MKRVTVICENSRGHEIRHVQSCGLGTDLTCAMLERWLRSGVQQAFKVDSCLTFTVAIHIEGASCDHEVPS